MRLATSFVAFTAALVLAASPAFGDEEDNQRILQLGPLFSPTRIEADLLRDNRLQSELKMTPAQIKDVKAILLDEALLKRYWTTVEKPNPSDPAKRYAANAKFAAEELQLLGKVLGESRIQRFKEVTLQREGMGIFRYPEIRSALELSDAEVKALRAEYGKVVQEAARLKLPPEKLGELAFGVPAGVRKLLPAGNRKKLDDMLGEPYHFKP